jgi:hypothetical protein
VATTPTWPSRTAIPDDDLQELEPPLWSRVFPAAP